MIQTSCSELLVDTKIYDVEEAYTILSKLFKNLGWEISPPLSIELLEKIKNAGDYDYSGEDTITDVIVYSKDGDRAYLEYGDNGYITTGFRFDSRCDQCDVKCFPIFEKTMENIEGSKIIACDGGYTDFYEDWKREKSSE